MILYVGYHEFLFGILGIAAQRLAARPARSLRGRCIIPTHFRNTMSGASFFRQLDPRIMAQSLYNPGLRQKTSQSLSVCHACDQTDARNHDLTVPKPASNNGRAQSPEVVQPLLIPQTLKK